MKRLFFVLILSIALLIIGCGASPKFTMEKYNRVRDGVSYFEVCAIMGEDGQEMSSSTMPGIPGVMTSLTTKAYGWKNPDGSNTIIMFQNDRMMMKSQFGLK